MANTSEQSKSLLNYRQLPKKTECLDNWRVLPHTAPPRDGITCSSSPTGVCWCAVGTAVRHSSLDTWCCSYVIKNTCQKQCWSYNSRQKYLKCWFSGLIILGNLYIHVSKVVKLYEIKSWIKSLVKLLK